MKNKLVVMQGIPACGKTTYAKELVKGKTDWVRVSRDDIRWMRGDYWIPDQEEYITQVENFMVNNALKNNLNVVVDATNLNPQTIKKWKRSAEMYCAEIEFKLIEIDVEEAVKRDASREHPMGENVIRGFYKKYFK